MNVDGSVNVQLLLDAIDERPGMVGHVAVVGTLKSGKSRAVSMLVRRALEGGSKVCAVGLYGGLAELADVGDGQLLVYEGEIWGDDPDLLCVVPEEGLVLSLLEAFWEKVCSVYWEKGRVMVIEGADRCYEDKKSARLLRDIHRRARMQKVVVVSTWAGVGGGYLNMCHYQDYHLLLRQDAQAADVMVDLFGLADSERSELLRYNAGEGLLVSSEGKQRVGGW